MARYIDADALKLDIDLSKGTTMVDLAISVIKAVKEAPTADVVPKSEVDKLIGKFECFLCHVTGSRLSKHTYDLRTMETVATDCINEAYNDGYGEGYKECAREIFEEIESISSDFPIYGNVNTVILSERDLAFIKKKYTEGKDEQASIQTDHKEEFKK